MASLVLTAKDSKQAFGPDLDNLVQTAAIEQDRAWIRWLVSIIVSGFLFAYVSPEAGALWLTVTLTLEAFSAWVGSRLIRGDLSMQHWRVGAVFAISLSWITHAALLWAQPEELARIAAIIDLFTMALYGAIGGRRDKAMLAALIAPPLIALGAMLIHYSWTEATPAVALVATLATLGACATIVGNALEMHRSDRLLVEAHATLREERDSLERRVAERTHELREARAAAETASQVKSLFLRTMSHELRTPLNGILGYAEILAEDIEAGEAKVEDAKRVAVAGRRLLHLVNDVLDLASLESGHASVALEESNIAEIIASACGSLSQSSRENGNSVSVTVAPEAQFVTTDAKRLLQILRHVIDNACKFTVRGEVHIDARRGEDNRMLEIEVTDTGRGMAIAEIERLFKPFEQASQDFSRTHEGAGLGLAITQRMLSLLNGRVRIKSTPGNGTRVLLTIPC